MGQTLGNLKNSMPGMGGTDVADPGQGWGNMDSSQKGAALIGGGLRGLGQGLQNYGQQTRAMPLPGAPGSPQVSDGPYGLIQPRRTGPNMLNFYGGG